jgi:hypothetical protein
VVTLPDILPTTLSYVELCDHVYGDNYTEGMANNAEMCGEELGTRLATQEYYHSPRVILPVVDRSV